MQQFTVPQFIDVESKIIGPVTTRQFVILLVAALSIALCYRLLDFTSFLIIGVIILIIAVLFAFVKINGRPFHFFILNILQTLRRANLRVWDHGSEIKEAQEAVIAPIKTGTEIEKKEYYQQSRLAEVALIVDTKGKYKGE